MITYYSDIVREVMESITPEERALSNLTDGIADRLDSVMKRKNISKSQLAKMTGHKPSEVTKWLGGGHNFTCKTIVLIQQAIGEDLVRVVTPRKRANTTASGE